MGTAGEFRVTMQALARLARTNPMIAKCAKQELDRRREAYGYLAMERAWRRTMHRDGEGRWL